MSFEYYNDENKIVTNCGYGNKISEKIEKMLKRKGVVIKKKSGEDDEEKLNKWIKFLLKVVTHFEV